MRLDYVMYVVAGLFFIITIISSVTTVVMETTQRQLWVVSTVVLGLLSIGFGYFQRPRAMVQAPQSNTPMHETSVTQTIEASAEPAAVVEKSPVIETTVAVESPTQPSSPTTEATSNLPVTHVKRSQVRRIKGIGQKRATQLSSLGINSFEELANASAEDVAKNLQMSPKIVKKWISEAKTRIK